MLEFISDQISITIERKRAEKKIKEALLQSQESDRLKSAFLANMSHEIRTPLNSIIGFSDLMLDPYFDTDQHIEFANIIKENGNNLLSIISDIMDLSKIEAGQLEVKKQLFSINQLIIEIHKEYSFKAIGKGLELLLDMPNLGEKCFIETDSTKLRQILVNLVSNAIKFTEEGRIEIGIKIVGNFLLFSVKDTGIGIPKEYHEKIFERFRQVETAHTRKYGGNGLGLPISKSLVELLGGNIWMESEPGKGTTFCFTIPMIG
jgi:signal transduction histidine kinase